MYFGLPLAPVSNRATWNGVVEVRDDDTDELFNLSLATEIVVEVRDECHVPVLTAKLSDSDVSITDTGIFTFTFSESQMRSLCAAKTYEVGVTVTADGASHQIYIGTLPVLDGVVS